MRLWLTEVFQFVVRAGRTWSLVVELNGTSESFFTADVVEIRVITNGRNDEIEKKTGRTFLSALQALSRCVVVTTEPVA